MTILTVLFVHLLLLIPLKFWYVWWGQIKLRYVIIRFLTRAVVILPRFDFIVLILVIYMFLVSVRCPSTYTLYFFLNEFFCIGSHGEFFTELLWIISDRFGCKWSDRIHQLVWGFNIYSFNNLYLLISGFNITQFVI